MNSAARLVDSAPPFWVSKTLTVTSFFPPDVHRVVGMEALDLLGHGEELIVQLLPQLFDRRGVECIGLGSVGADRGEHADSPEMWEMRKPAQQEPAQPVSRFAPPGAWANHDTAALGFMASEKAPL